MQGEQRQNMGEFWFVLKSLIAAAFLLWVLQLKVGNETLELKAQTYIESSAAVNNVRDVAVAAVHVTQVGIDKAKEWLTKESADLKIQSEKRARNNN